MPLKRDDYGYHTNLSGTFFAMTDGKTRFIYQVSSEALRDRAAADGLIPGDLVQVFLRYRKRIEQIASEKFEAGIKDRLIRSADLTPLPSTR